MTLSDADFSMFTMTDAPKPAMPNVRVYTSDDDKDDLPIPGKKKTTGKEFEGLAKVDLTTPLREDEVMPERRHHVVPEWRVEDPALSKKNKKTQRNRRKRARRRLVRK